MKHIAALLIIPLSTAVFAQGKSADECEAEAEQGISLELKRARVMDCLLGNPPGTSKPIKTARSPFKGDKFACEAIKTASCVEGAEHSGTLAGVRYAQYGDASGWVDATPQGSSANTGQQNRWSIRCDRDAMTNKKTCTANLDDLWVAAQQDGRITVSVGYKHFPGSTTSIRIANSRYDTKDRDGDFLQSNAIVKQLKDGNKLVTRYMKWPYRSWIDVERELYGADAAVALVTWSAKNIK